jgi:hypothetical protein
VICGAVKAIDGGSALVCTREAAHLGPHAVLHLGHAFTQWGEGITWTTADQARRDARHQWVKPHVRRAYQTLAMWKVGR